MVILLAIYLYVWFTYYYLAVNWVVNVCLPNQLLFVREFVRVKQVRVKVGQEQVGGLPEPPFKIDCNKKSQEQYFSWYQVN